MKRSILSIGSTLVIVGILLSSCGQSPTPTSQTTPDPVPTSPQVTETKKATISGNVWHDQNQDARRDAKEEALANWTIYIDSNNNSKLDAGERKTLTNTAGDYSFSDLAPGSYNIRQILPEKWASSEALVQNYQQGNKGRSSLTPQVINGTVSNTSYSWMTGLISRGNTAAEGHFCGGALIAPRFVLTAAHCIEEETASGVDVLIGVNNLRNESSGERIQVTKIHSNPNYRDEGDVLVADVAVLELARASTKTPVNLVNNTAIQNTGAIARVMGWGNRSTTGEDFPLQLHEVDVPVRSDAECTAAYNKNGKSYNDAWICAAPKQGGKDSCQGDSGGPLVIKSGGVWNHVGVVSFGEGCALETHPGVYAQTSTYLPWIKSIANGISPTPNPQPTPLPTPQPQPNPQPTPQPQPNPQPITQPTPVPNPQPTPEPTPDPIIDEPYDDFYDEWDWYYFIEIFEDEIFDDLDFGNYYW